MQDPGITDYFALNGPLAQALPGYRPRVAQIELACAIQRTIDSRSTLVAEAGTGIGKTWAYLVPTLLNGGKVLISTGTRTLQDQLFNRDLPRVREALAVPVTTALLKGRGNYLCHYHLDRLADDERALKSRSEIVQLRHIRAFAQSTQTGDRADLGDVPEESEIWQRVTSTRENCLGQDCPRIRDCFVVKARRQAQEADVVVINHALFMADIVLREDGVTDLLPEVDTVIFDEAHQLPDTATRFLGSSVSTHQLLDFGRAAEAAGLAQARAVTDWSDANRRIEHAARELRLCCAPLEKLPGRKATFDAIPQPEVFDAALIELRAAVESATRALASVAEKHPDLAAAERAGQEIVLRLARWATPARPGRQDDDLEHEGWGRDTNAPEPNAASVPARGAAVTPSAAPVSALPVASALAPASASTSAPTSASALTPAAVAKSPAGGALNWAGPAVRWVEQGTHHIRLHSAPLSVAQIFSRFRRPDQAWILTSATLSVASDFGHFTRQLGLAEAQTGRWESPFDYREQGLLYVPRGLPEPSSPQFTQCFVDMLVPLLHKSPGGSLILCTTLRAVENVAARLADVFEHDGLKWPLLKQGDATRRELLDRFRTLSHPVLVGSASFWEGIDLPGRILTLVAIDKLPFAPPDDPVIQARLRACRERGGNPFAEYQLPEAAIALKQGAGRLIRTEEDWGVLVVGDTRLVDKPYGKQLWRGLPPFSRTRDLAETLAFFERKAGVIA